MGWIRTNDLAYLMPLGLRLLSRLRYQTNLCGMGHLRATHAVITLPISERTVPARGTLIP